MPPRRRPWLYVLLCELLCGCPRGAASCERLCVRLVGSVWASNFHDLYRFVLACLWPLGKGRLLKQQSPDLHECSGASFENHSVNVVKTQQWCYS